MGKGLAIMGVWLSVGIAVASGNCGGEVFMGAVMGTFCVAVFF